MQEVAEVAASMAQQPVLLLQVVELAGLELLALLAQLTQEVEAEAVVR
jgi:hypothetical protein